MTEASCPNDFADTVPRRRLANGRRADDLASADRRPTSAIRLDETVSLQQGDSAADSADRNPALCSELSGWRQWRPNLVSSRRYGFSEQRCQILVRVSSYGLGGVRRLETGRGMTLALASAALVSASLTHAA